MMKTLIKEAQRLQHLAGILNENKLTPEEQTVVDDLLSNLNEGTFDDLLSKAKDYATKGLLTASVVTALLLSPQISSAQKNQIKDIAKTNSVENVDKKGTYIDGFNGKYTSNFIFPKTILDSTNITNARRDLIFKQTSSFTKKDLGVEGNNDVNKIAKELGVTSQQMKEWNDFVVWMRSKGYAGSEKMNSGSFNNSVLEQYKQIKPDFWVKGKDEVKKIQTIIKTYRSQSIEQWKLGKIKIPINGKEMNPNNVIDVKTIENNFMPWAKDPN